MKPTKGRKKKMCGKGKKGLKKGSVGTCNIIVPEDAVLDNTSV
jgi:hypothetical protein